MTRIRLGSALVVVIGLIAPVAVTHGQGPAFDAATIRPNLDEDSARTLRVTPTSLTFQSVSLLNCLEEAYGVTPHQITGPGWIRTERYDIDARTSEPLTRVEMMARLRTLLADRFTLSLRHEQREARVFALVVGKSGPRLTAASDQGEGQREGGKTKAMAMGFRSTSMPELAAYLGRQGPIGVPVVDETNLTGRFDFVLTFLRGENSSDEVKRTMVEAGPTTYIDALRDLGLGLESRRRPIEMIVVDRAERVPTPN